MVKFPEFKLGYESSKTQLWGTTVQTTGSGRVRTLTNRLYAKWVIKLMLSHLTNEEQREFMGFFALHHGAGKPFLWKDPEDFHEEKIQLVPVAPGIYQAVMKQGAYVQPVSYIENVTVFVDRKKKESNEYSVTDGRIRFNTPPAGGAIITATYDYCWKVMFEKDEVEVIHSFADYNQAKTVKLVTVE